MTHETKPQHRPKPRPYATGTCVFCRKNVTRAYPESPWRTGDGGWKCPDHPRADTSVIHPHEAG